jgi:molybdopterin synthase catalytic subunit
MIEITRRRIDVPAVLGSVRREEAGAVVLFLGTVRAEPDVAALDYEVYVPMAEKVLGDLVAQARRKFGIFDMSIVHRLGRVPVGRDSVAIACSAAHRREAFEACAWAMDEIKRIVPIWKSEPSPRRRGKAGARSH